MELPVEALWGVPETAPHGPPEDREGQSLHATRVLRGWTESQAKADGVCGGEHWQREVNISQILLQVNGLWLVCYP